MSLIKCTDLSIGYNDRIILSNLNFEIGENDYLCIIGENGSGKSTLIKSLLKLQKQISGKIEYCDNLKSNEIGYLPQRSNIQRDFPASVKEIVLSGSINKMGFRPFYSRKNHKKALHNMELVVLHEVVYCADRAVRTVFDRQDTILAESFVYGVENAFESCEEHCVGQLEKLFARGLRV